MGFEVPDANRDAYIQSLRALIYDNRLTNYFSVKNDPRHNPRLMEQYKEDLEYYEKKYADYYHLNAPKPQSIKTGFGKSAEEELHKRGYWQYGWEKNEVLPFRDKVKYALTNRQSRPGAVNVDAQRIAEIESKFTSQNMVGFFPRAELGHHLSRHSFAILDTEVDDKGQILTVAAMKLKYDYTSQQLVQTNEPRDSFFRVYNPANLNVNKTESIHGLNRGILTALRNKLGGNYPSNWDKSQLQDLQDFLGSSVMVGHNIEAADIPWLYQKGMNSGWRGYKGSFLDTLHFARELWKGQKNDLEALSERLGVPFSSIPGLQHHDVASDVVVTAKVFEKLLQNVSFIRNNIDIDKYQTRHYDYRRSLQGASGFFVKPNGGMIMDENEINELMGAEQVFDAGTGFDKEGNNTGFGKVGELIRTLASQRRGDGESSLGAKMEQLHISELRDAIASARRMARAGSTRQAIKDLITRNYAGTNLGAESLRLQNAIETGIAEAGGIQAQDVIDNGPQLEAIYENARDAVGKRIAQSHRFMSQGLRYWSAGNTYSGFGGIRAPSVGEFYAGLDANTVGGTNNYLDKAVNSRQRLEKIKADSQARVSAKREMYNAYADKISATFKLRDDWQGQITDASVSIQDFTDRLKEAAKATQKSTKDTKDWAEALKQNTHNLNLGRYAGLYATAIKGSNEVGDALTGLLPDFMQEPVRRFNTGITQIMEGEQAQRQARWNRWSTGLSLGIGGLTTVLSGGNILLGNMATGAAKTVSNMVFEQMNANITERYKNLAGNINLLSSVLQALYTPLRLFGKGLNLGLSVFTKLGKLWGTDFGVPLQHLTGIQGPAYSNMLAADRLFGMKSGTTNSLHNNLAYQQAGLYTSGQFDEKALVAAARLGIFDLAYAPMGGDTQTQMADIVDRMTDEIERYGLHSQQAQEKMFLMSQYNSALPEMVERMYRYRKRGIKSYRDVQNGNIWKQRDVYYNPMNDIETTDWNMTAGDWGAATLQLQYGLKRFANPLWDTFGRPTMNAVNRTLEYAAERGEDGKMAHSIKDIASYGWNQVTGALGIDAKEFSWEKFKKSIEDTLGFGILDGFKKAVEWLHGQANLLLDLMQPVFNKLQAFFEDMHVTGNIFSGFTMSFRSQDAYKTAIDRYNATKADKGNEYWEGGEDFKKDGWHIRVYNRAQNDALTKYFEQEGLTAAAAARGLPKVLQALGLKATDVISYKNGNFMSDNLADLVNWLATVVLPEAAGDLGNAANEIGVKIETIVKADKGLTAEAKASVERGNLQDAMTLQGTNIELSASSRALQLNRARGLANGSK